MTLDYYTFIGTLVVGLGVIVALFFAVHNPLSKIEHRLTQIEDELKSMTKTLGSHQSTLEKHENKLIEHDIEIERLKK